MSATSVVGFVKKSVGWSIGLSVLMIVAVNSFGLAARFQRMRPSGVRLV